MKLMTMLGAQKSWALWTHVTSCGQEPKCFEFSVYSKYSETSDYSAYSTYSEQFEYPGSIMSIEQLEFSENSSSKDCKVLSEGSPIGCRAEWVCGGWRAFVRFRVSSSEGLWGCVVLRAFKFVDKIKIQTRRLFETRSTNGMDASHVYLFSVTSFCETQLGGN